ncbi:MAG TPA: 3'-5' exonuclease [Gemmatimonadaceae bacterium]|nr:3'-5' exonuclease [Gemmatimonadaceae bacterium]
MTAGDILVLAPRRQLGYAVRDALLGRGVVAHSFFNEQALDGNPTDLNNSQAQQAFALLTLLADAEDRVALRCWCGFGSNTLNEVGWRRLRAHCEQTGETPRLALQRLERGDFRIAHTGAIVDRYRLLVQQENAIGALRGHDLADALFPDGEEWSAQLRTIVASAFAVGADFDARELLDEVRIGVTQMETPIDVDFVRVMSLHKSKGLTAKIVVVMGCIEGMIPSIDFEAPMEEQRRSMEEQRRLFYVALTRTTETLILSSATAIPADQAYQMGVRVGPGGRVQASAFMTDLGRTRPAAVNGDDILN